MVIAAVYGYIDKQTDGIDRHIDRHKDMENGDKREAIHPDAYLSGVIWSLLVRRFVYCLEFCRLSVHFGSVHFGCQIDWLRFLTSYKKIF